MTLATITKCFPGVGPLFNAGSHALAGKAGTPAVKEAYQFRALVNTITHLFLTAICFIPKVAASVPHFTPWVFGALAVVSLVHYLVCKFLLGESSKGDAKGSEAAGSAAA